MLQQCGECITIIAYSLCSNAVIRSHNPYQYKVDAENNRLVGLLQEDCRIQKKIRALPILSSIIQVYVITYAINYLNDDLMCLIIQTIRIYFCVDLDSINPSTNSPLSSSSM